MFDRFVRGVRRRVWQRLYPKHYWHMRHYDRRFALVWRDGRASVSWCGKQVAVSIRPDECIPTSSSLAIVGSGPTLSRTPSRAWHNRDIACVNGSILWAHERNLRPRFYVVTDAGFARRQLGVIRAALDTADIICLTIRCLFEALRQSPDLFAGKRLLILDHINQPFGRNLYTHAELAARPRVLIDPDRYYENRSIIGVSGDLQLGVFTGGTVVLAAAQIGIAAGYRDIHFLGLDMKQSGPGTRFYDERKPEPSYIDRNFDDLILPSFAVLRHYCDAQGIDLCNWSTDSAIPRSLVPEAPAALEPALPAE